MVCTAKSDGHLRLHYVLPAENIKKIKDLHLVEYNIYIYQYQYIYIYQYQHIYIKYTHAHQSSEFYSQSLISLTHFWIHRLGNARGGLAAHSAGASQSCGNAPWAGDRWNLVMWTMELGWNMVKHSGLIMNNGYLRHIHEYFLCNMIFHHIFALEQWILDPYDSIL